MDKALPLFKQWMSKHNIWDKKLCPLFVRYNVYLGDDLIHLEMNKFNDIICEYKKISNNNDIILNLKLFYNNKDYSKNMPPNVIKFKLELMEKRYQEIFSLFDCCPLCNVSRNKFKTSQSWKRHMQLYHNIKCSECKLIFTNKDNLSEHRNNIHYETENYDDDDDDDDDDLSDSNSATNDDDDDDDDDDSSVDVDSTDDDDDDDSSNDSSHSKDYDNITICPFNHCKKGFRTSELLKVHICSHSNINKVRKPYNCVVCNDRENIKQNVQFRTKNELKDHYINAHKSVNESKMKLFIDYQNDRKYMNRVSLTKLINVVKQGLDKEQKSRQNEMIACKSKNYMKYLTKKRELKLFCHIYKKADRKVFKDSHHNMGDQIKQMNAIYQKYLFNEPNEPNIPVTMDAINNNQTPNNNIGNNIIFNNTNKMINIHNNNNNDNNTIGINNSNNNTNINIKNSNDVDTQLSYDHNIFDFKKKGELIQKLNKTKFEIDSPYLDSICNYKFNVKNQYYGDPSLYCITFDEFNQYRN